MPNGKSGVSTKVSSIISTELNIDKDAMKKLGLIAVAYSNVEREWFPTQEAYIAELEVEERAQQVIGEIEKLGLKAKGYKGDQYFLTNILVDKPDLIVNLVDTVKGKDRLQTSIPAALELANIRYTGAGMQGLVIGNNRHLFKQLLIAHEIPTPTYKFIRDLRTPVPNDFPTPIIVKLNESGGSVGIDNFAVKDSIGDAQKKVEEMINAYKIPVIIEQFMTGPEITAVVFDDGSKKHVFLAKKKFRLKPDGKYEFTSLESYDDEKAYKYEFLDDEMEKRVKPFVVRAFDVLKYGDYAKFDIRYDEATKTPMFIDCNPNTAFGPDKGLPMTEVLAMHGVDFSDMLASLISKHAKRLEK